MSGKWVDDISRKVATQFFQDGVQRQLYADIKGGIAQWCWRFRKEHTADWQKKLWALLGNCDEKSRTTIRGIVANVLEAELERGAIAFPDADGKLADNAPIRMGDLKRKALGLLDQISDDPDLPANVKATTISTLVKFAEAVDAEPLNLIIERFDEGFPDAISDVRSRLDELVEQNLARLTGGDRSVVEQGEQQQQGETEANE